MKDIKIVIGANFGDEGKGKLTDYYTKNADNCIVVCSNGGAQRGHTVLKLDKMPTLNHRIYMMDIALPRDIDPNINIL